MYTQVGDWNSRYDTCAMWRNLDRLFRMFIKAHACSAPQPLHENQMQLGLLEISKSCALPGSTFDKIPENCWRFHMCCHCFSWRQCSILQKLTGLQQIAAYFHVAEWLLPESWWVSFIYVTDIWRNFWHDLLQKWGSNTSLINYFLGILIFGG